MVTAVIPVEHQALGEKRVSVSGLTWDAYQQILHALPEGRSTRLTYDHGTLEITMPLEEHEYASELIGLFIRILVGAMGLKLKSLRSTTLERPDLDRSAEPDNAYYIQHQAQVAGRKVNLSQDPPPDLVVEVDITHTDIVKDRLYASMGVPEFWRYNGQVWRIFQLQGEAYHECDRSPTFDWVNKEDLYRFLEQAQQDEIAAEQALRSWAQEQCQQKLQQ